MSSTDRAAPVQLARKGAAPTNMCISYWWDQSMVVLPFLDTTINAPPVVAARPWVKHPPSEQLCSLMACRQMQCLYVSLTAP